MSPSPVPRRRELERLDAAAIMEMDAVGVAHAAISRALNVSRDSVRRVLSDPVTYDPHLDHVAIDRAHRGDLPVYQRLTHWERQAFLDLLMWEIRSGEPHRLAYLWRGPTWDSIAGMLHRRKVNERRRMQRAEARADEQDVA